MSKKKGKYSGKKNKRREIYIYIYRKKNRHFGMDHLKTSLH